MAEVEQSVSKRLNEEKIIADPIHGMMAFEPYLLKIINHRYFQRLRNIKQMQGVEHVYPGGVHSRFSHSLGVCYLAGKVLDTLEKYETNIEEDDKMCVKIAALCHDIGHGPYSHLYETVVNEQDGVKWEHEDQSLKITEVLLKKLGIFNDDIRDKAIEKIKTMIKGKKVEDMTDEEREKAFLFQMKVINYGNKEKNPIENVYFYGKGEKLEVINYVESITPMVPKCFEENTIQIICTLSKEESKRINRDQIIKVADVDALIKNIFK